MLVTGGVGPNPVFFPYPPCTRPESCTPFVSTNTSEIWDPATNTWTAGPSMPYNRYGHDQVFLPGNRILLTGGFGGGARRPLPCTSRRLIKNSLRNVRARREHCVGVVQEGGMHCGEGRVSHACRAHCLLWGPPAGNQNFPDPGLDDAELTSSLVYNITTNAFYPTGSLPQTDTNSFNNPLGVLFNDQQFELARQIG